ncbi:conserved hypothetical protein [Virus Rctr197k]|nr:conserved hypothetical protein [Virus Rctr197k]
MIEAGVVIDTDGKPIHWHLPPGRSGGSLPDSRELWTIIWENRDRISGFAHTHPWNGDAWPSGTDITTFEAIEAALGRELSWWVVTLDQVALIRRDHDTHGPPYQWGVHKLRANEPEPAWVDRLRELSRGSTP